MGFFKPVWKTDRLPHFGADREIERTNSQSKLTEIAKKAPNIHVRLMALQKITKQSVLIDFVKSDSDSRVRRAALHFFMISTSIDDATKYCRQCT